MTTKLDLSAIQPRAVFVAPDGGDSGVLTRNVLAACAYAGLGGYFGPEAIADTAHAVEQMLNPLRLGRSVMMPWDYALNVALTMAATLGVPAHVFLALRAGRSDPAAKPGAPLS